MGGIDLPFVRPFGAHRWGFALLFALVAIELATAASFASRYLDRDTGSIFQIRELSVGLTGWFLIPLVWLATVAVALVRRKIDSPTRTILRIVRRNQDWLLRGFLLAVIHIPVGQAFSALKSSIPFIDPFSWDKSFADLDRSLLGTDAWLITHRLIGEAGTVAIDRTYVLWGTYLILLAGWISFTRDRDLQIKAALAFNLTWFLLGIVLATLLASAGPCFFDKIHGGTRFAGLMTTLESVDDRHGLWAFKAMGYLTENAGTGKLGAGISAMPSLHVAMATLGVILAFAARARTWIKMLAVTFAGIIVLGSVHLGWHYLIDGLVSIPVTILVWLASHQIVEKLRVARPLCPKS